MARASGSRAHSRASLAGRGWLGGDAVGAEPAGQQRGVLRRWSARPGRAAWAPSAAIRPASWLRLVTGPGSLVRRAAAGGPGRASRALSSTMSMLRAGQQAAVQADWRPSRLAGICAAGTARASRKLRSASAGRSGSAGPKPRRFTYSCPPGNRPACLVRPVHRQRGLAHPRRPADHRDRRRAIAVWRFWQQRRHRGKLGCPPGEPGNLGGQHPRARGSRQRGECPRRRRVPWSREAAARGRPAECAGSARAARALARCRARRPAGGGCSGRRPAPRPAVRTGTAPASAARAPAPAAARQRPVPRSSGMSSRCRPRCSWASILASSAPRRSSVSRWPSVRARAGDGTSASGCPRHTSSAAVSRSAASGQAPARAAARPAAMPAR